MNQSEVHLHSSRSVHFRPSLSPRPSEGLVPRLSEKLTSIELARLKKEERRKNIWPVLRVPGLVPSRYFLAPLGVSFVVKTLRDEWYVVIKAYKLTVFDILRDFLVLPYIACPRYPYIRVYRLHDTT